MRTLVTSVITGATWVADALDDLLGDVMIGFGNAAPLVTPDDERRLENPPAPAP